MVLIYCIVENKLCLFVWSKKNKLYLYVLK
nr:MAG TPA: hypothetical protein [Bacteriophage sp.]